MKTCTACGEVKSIDAFHRDRSRADGHSARCKACVSPVRPRAQRQTISTVALFRQVPTDYRVSGLAFAIAPSTFARSVDGDWYEVKKGKLRPVWADEVETRLLIDGARYITRLLEER